MKTKILSTVVGGVSALTLALTLTAIPASATSTSLAPASPKSAQTLSVTTQTAAVTDAIGLAYSTNRALLPCFVSDFPRVGAVRYSRYAHNKCGVRVKARLVNLATGVSRTYKFGRGQYKRMQVRLGGGRQPRYAIVARPLSGTRIYSGGEWTPRYGTWRRATAQRQYFRACARNPLHGRAVYMGLSGSIGAPLRLKDYTRKYIRPGVFACVSWRQKPGTLKRITVQWKGQGNRQTARYVRDGREIAPNYWSDTARQTRG